jgi:hypothetical protein
MISQPVFIFSVDSPQPVFLSEQLSTAVSIGSVVIAIQNGQLKMRTGYYCGGHLQTMNGRNPLASILMNIGGSIVGFSETSAWKSLS